MHKIGKPVMYFENLCISQKPIEISKIADKFSMYKHLYLFNQTKRKRKLLQPVCKM